MVARPHNHVTEAMRLLTAPGAEWPEVPEELVLYLEALYPAKCYRADERPEDHLLYAGAQGLVADLRGVFEEQRQRAEDPEPDTGAASAEIPLNP